jgi:hypothetical protein
MIIYLLNIYEDVNKFTENGRELATAMVDLA